MSAPWLRLDAAVFQEPRVSSVCPPFGALTWVAVLTMSKLHGWDGLCPAELMTGGAIARHVGAEKGMATRFDAAVKGLLSGGLLVRDGENLSIPEWRRFQPDPTGAMRQAAHRQRVKVPRHAVTVTTVSHDDVTGRDGTGRRSQRLAESAVDVDSSVAARSTPPPTPPPTTSEAGAGALEPHGQGETTTPGGTAATLIEPLCPTCNGTGRLTGSRKCCACSKGRDLARGLARGRADDRQQEGRARAARGRGTSALDASLQATEREEAERQRQIRMLRGESA